MEIPKQLQKPEFRFCTVHPKEKRPVGNDWQNKNLHSFDSEELLTHLKKGGNYGVRAGFGGLVTIDADTKEVADAVTQNLPPTFAVKTGRKSGEGEHFYFTCKVKVEHKTLKIGKNNVGDLNKTQIIGAGSTHPSGNKYKVINDVPIAEVSKQDLMVALSEFFIPTTKFESKEKPNIVQVVENYMQLKKSGNWLLGNCPFHPDKNPSFVVNPAKDYAYCISEDIGGDAYWFVMQKDNCSFPDAKKKVNQILGIETSVAMVTEDEVIDKNNSEIRNFAMSIAKEHDPLCFCIEVVARKHVGEKDAIALLILSGISSGFQNRKKTLHVCSVGGSGKGKSSVMDSVSELFTNVQKIDSSSSKSQFYKAKANEMIDKGILYFNEADNSEQGRALMRAYTDKSNTPPTHETLDINRKFTRMTINEINAVWVNSVDLPHDNDGQLINRFLGFNVDESKEQDEEVFDFQKQEFLIRPKLKLDSELMLAKVLTELIKKDPKNIIVPFYPLIDSNSKSNRRSLPKFLSLLHAVTYINRFQRVDIDGNLIATIDDFKVAEFIWKRVSAIERLHIPKKLQEILVLVPSDDYVAIEYITKSPDIKVSESTVRRRLFELKEHGLVDYKIDENANTKKYLFKAFKNFSRVSIFLKSPDEKENELRQAYRKLKELFGEEIFQIPDLLRSEDGFLEYINQEFSNIPNFEKLKSLVESDKKSINSEQEASSQKDEKSLKSTCKQCKMEVIKDWIENELCPNCRPEIIK